MDRPVIRDLGLNDRYADDRQSSSIVRRIYLAESHLFNFPMDRPVIRDLDLGLNSRDADDRKSSSLAVSRLYNFPMGLPAIKELGLNDRDAYDGKNRIYVEGYDTSLSVYDVVGALREHFASCGEVIDVYTPGFDYKSTLHRFAFIYIRGEGAQDKALKLSGSSMGGRTIVAEAYPFQATHLDPELAPMRDTDNKLHRKVGVTGFDSSLPCDYVESMLIKHFSKCGLVPHASVSRCQDAPLPFSNMAYVSIVGQDAIEKALQLGGCDLEGLKNVRIFRVARLAQTSCTFDPNWLNDLRTKYVNQISTESVESSMKKTTSWVNDHRIQKKKKMKKKKTTESSKKKKTTEWKAALP